MFALRVWVGFGVLEGYQTTAEVYEVVQGFILLSIKPEQDMILFVDLRKLYPNYNKNCT